MRLAELATVSNSQRLKLLYVGVTVDPEIRPFFSFSLRFASLRFASHRIASHRIASHRIASHRIASLFLA